MRCYQIYKEQKLKANHNLHRALLYNWLVVIKYTKNKSWKQITTPPCGCHHRWCCYQIYKEQKLKANHNSNMALAVDLMLLSNIQRTKVESKSQHGVGWIETSRSCYQIYKEQKLKANHNRFVADNETQRVVIKYTKNKSWKQITTKMEVEGLTMLLLSNIQRTKVESKSQLQLVA